jgi:peptidyl-prolyl cis-trans isomerase B (cyclophilin B)
MSSALALWLLLPAAQAADPGAHPPNVVVTTSAGAFVVRLLPELAPKHVAHFLKVVEAGGFDGTTFHRIIPRGIVQGGDPLSKNPKQASQYGTGGLGLLKAEFSDRPMARGVVAAVRRPKDPNSAGQQFFVVLSDQPSLTGQFTIFGEVVEGMDVADRLGETPVEGDRAVPRVEMTIKLAPGTGVPAP